MLALAVWLAPVQSLVTGSMLSPRGVGRPFGPNPAQWSNMSAIFGQADPRLLLGRQSCATGYYECSDGSGCCPDGDTCTSTGCCDGDEVQCGPGTCYNPSTEKCCPNGGYCSPGKDCCGYEYCYNPTTEICCSQGQGTCDLGDVCCTNECCPSDGSCGSDGYCTANICYETSTYTTTSYATIYKTITEIATPEEEEEAPEFECIPITATNSVGDTLELGDDCLLTLSPASNDASTTADLAGRETLPTLQPVPRAANDDCAYTSTIFDTYTINTLTTRFFTVTETEVPDDFSCPTMAVTNAAGDELSLDDKCQLEFSPGAASPTASPTLAGIPSLPGSSGGSSGGAGGNSAAQPGIAADIYISTALIGVSLSTLIGAIVL